MGTRTHVARMYPAMLGGERCEQSTCSHSYSETTCAAAETSHKTHKLTTFDFLISDLRSGAARSKRELCLLVLIGTFSEEHGFNKTMPYTTRELNGRVGGGRSPSHPHQLKCTPMSGTRPCLRRPPVATHEAKAATAAALPSPNRLPERPYTSGVTNALSG
jgi:hypothetical protein